MIRILDDHTANGIAAGEVVERPASVAKELIENSLDAGGSRISIEVKQGGIKFLRVADNGLGMNPDDARKAFLRHATSKLTSLNDLNDLHTMGFRGEALASIAAVSKVRLITRRRDSDQAFILELKAGEIVNQAFGPGSEGTIIEVNELFYNTPARYKFLKRDSTEAAYITDVVERHAFSRPDVSFSLIKDGKQSMLTPGDGKLLSVIYSIWGADSAEAAIPLDNQYNNIKISGYISNSSHSRKNRGRQIFIVNGRVIQSPIIRLAVDRAIQGHFVKSTFPELILKINLTNMGVDVNVHPQKTELRFADEQEIFRAVYHTIKNTLNAATAIKEIPQSFEIDSGLGQASQASEKQDTSDDDKTLGNSTNQQDLSPEPVARPKQLEFEHITQASKSQLSTSYTEALQERLHPMDQAQIFAEIGIQTASRKQAQNDGSHIDYIEDSREENSQTCPEECTTPISNEPKLSDARIIGQVYKTYLLLEYQNKMLIVDQHAAHERILYEELLRAGRTRERGQSQLLLEPILVKFSPLEIEAALDQADEIKNMGFDFEQFSDDTLILRAVALDPKKDNYSPKRAFEAIVEEAREGLLSHSDNLDKALHMVACKSAIKANDLLSYTEMKTLLVQLEGLDDPYHCPHGRPVIISLTQKQIEKLFERSL